MQESTNNSNPKNKCYFCVNGLDEIDYKDGATLRKFMSAQSKIMPTRRSHMCAKHQRQLAEAIKRARIMAIVPFVNK
ncbi:MAG: 30S ribosomal protein S18 [Parcubacteria group bacterium]